MKWAPQVTVSGGYSGDDYDDDEAFPEDNEQGRQQTGDRNATTKTTAPPQSDTPVRRRKISDSRGFGIKDKRTQGITIAVRQTHCVSRYGRYRGWDKIPRTI